MRDGLEDRCLLRLPGGHHVRVDSFPSWMEDTGMGTGYCDLAASYSLLFPLNDRQREFFEHLLGSGWRNPCWTSGAARGSISRGFSPGAACLRPGTGRVDVSRAAAETLARPCPDPPSGGRRGAPGACPPADLIRCLGNTLAHLPDRKGAQGAVRRMAEAFSKGTPRRPDGELRPRPAGGQRILPGHRAYPARWEPHRFLPGIRPERAAGAHPLQNPSGEPPRGSRRAAWPWCRCAGRVDSVLQGGWTSGDLRLWRLQPGAVRAGFPGTDPSGTQVTGGLHVDNRLLVGNECRTVPPIRSAATSRLVHCLKSGKEIPLFMIRRATTCALASFALICVPVSQAPARAAGRIVVADEGGTIQFPRRHFLGEYTGESDPEAGGRRGDQAYLSRASVACSLPRLTVRSGGGRVPAAISSRSPSVTAGSLPSAGRDGLRHRPTARPGGWTTPVSAACEEGRRRRRGQGLLE